MKKIDIASLNVCAIMMSIIAILVNENGTPLELSFTIAMAINAVINSFFATRHILQVLTGDMEL